MSKIINHAIALLFVLLAFNASAQQEDVAMADGFRAEGKIYVVVAMVLIILIGFIVYLALIDRKISRLEKRMPDKNESR